MHMYH